MPKKNIKNIPRRVNTDDDIRIVEEYDLRDALNIRIMSSGNDGNGAIENIKSNVSISIANKPLGVNTQVGTIKHSEKNDLYVCFHNSQGNHFIVRYNSITKIARIVLKNSLLNFTRSCFVNGFAVSGNNEADTLLYLTENVNQPMQINVTRAERHTDGDYTNGYPNPLTEEHIRWVKYVPTSKPEILLGQDTSIVYNNISNKMFQFRYRYKHKDGQYTAYSPVSDISISEYQLNNNIFSHSDDLVYNYIDVTINNGFSEIDKIEIIVREGNDGVWLLFKEVNNNILAPTQSIRFYNDDTYTFVNNEDALKNYDAVPLKARTAEYIANRALFGNTVDGYDNISQTELDNKTTFNAFYLENKDEQPITISTSYVISTAGKNKITITFNTSGLTIGNGDVVILEFDVKHLLPATTIPNTTQKYYFEWVAGVGDDITDFISDAIAYFNSITDTSGYVGYISSSNVANNFVFVVEEIFEIHDIQFQGINVYTSKQLKTSKGASSFKAGAKHPLGVVYLDKAGRASGVQKTTNNAPYVKWFSERSSSDYERGAANIDWRLGYKPPIWADRYQIVYGGNSSVGKFLQYTVAMPFYDINTKGKYGNKNIYLTFNNFLGSSDVHPDAYVTSRNPLIGYKYEEGDRIRIIKVPTGDTIADREFVNTYYDFKILGFEYFANSATENPFYMPSTNNREGWTLIVEDPEVDGYSYNDIVTNPDDNSWYKLMPNDLGNTALVEIYNNTSKNIENIFYEFGEEFPIIDAGLLTRRHGGVRDQNETISALTIQSIFSNVPVFGVKRPSYIEINYGNSEPNLFVGDKIKFAIVNGNTPAGTYTISKKLFNSYTGFWRFYTDEALGAISISDVSTVNLDPAYLYAAGTLKNGDVWYKPRYLVTGRISNSNIARLVLIENVEDYYANDFFQSNYWNKGRIHTHNPYLKQQRRKSTVWISESLFPEDNTNGLSSFNLANKDLPFKDYDRSLGSIQLLKRREDSLIMYQENRVSLIDVNKMTVKTGDGGDIVMLSGAVLGEQNTYVGDYGICENPESWCEQDGKQYFVDIKRGKALRLSQDGLTPISDYKFSKIFDDASRQLMALVNSSNLKIYGGFDREYGEYNITFESIDVGRLSIDDVPLDFQTAKVSQNETKVLIAIDRYEKADNVKTVIDGELFLTEDLYDVVSLEKITTLGVIPLSQERLDELETFGEVVVGIESDGEILSGTLLFKDSMVEIEKTNGVFDVTVEYEYTVPAFTVVFHESTNSWIGHRSYTPNGYADMNYNFFSFENDGMYEHNVGANYNTFFGSSYASILTPILKLSTSDMLVLNSISTESNIAFNATNIYSSLGTTSFGRDRFVEMEGNWYADVPKAETTYNSKNSHIIGIGQPSASTLNTKTFTSPLNALQLAIGDILYNNTATVYLGEITDIDYTNNIITHSTPLNAVVGVDFLYVQKLTKEEGEPIRGYAFRVTLEQPTDKKTEYLELFAVNANITKSNLTLD